MFYKTCLAITHAISLLAAAVVMGFILFLWQLREHNLDMQTVTDGIIVLTGGKGRVAYGVNLYKQGLGKKLYISGVHHKVSAHTLAAKQDIPLQSHALVKEAHLGYLAQNTIQNAQESAQWIQDHNLTSIRLVTADYHLQRSILELKRFSPTVKVIAHPLKTVHGLNKKSIKLLWGEYLKLVVRWCDTKLN